MSDIATRVKEIIVDKLGVDETEVTPRPASTNTDWVQILLTLLTDHELTKNSISEFPTIRLRP